MFPTKQDTGGLCVPLVSFTGRAPYVSKHMEIPRKAEKGIPPVDFSTGGIPLIFSYIIYAQRRAIGLLARIVSR